MKRRIPSTKRNDIIADDLSPRKLIPSRSHGLPSGVVHPLESSKHRCRMNGNARAAKSGRRRYSWFEELVWEKSAVRINGVHCAPSWYPDHGTDRYFVPVIGRINGAKDMGRRTKAGGQCDAGGRREMDGTREKKRRFHLKRGSWGRRRGWRGGGWRGPRKLRPFRLTMPLRLISRTISLWLDASALIYWVFQ